MRLYFIKTLFTHLQLSSIAAVAGILSHLLMLTMDVFPAFFNTSSHSSSSPRILYLRIKSSLLSDSRRIREMKTHLSGVTQAPNLVLTLPGPFPLLSPHPVCVSPQTPWLLHSVSNADFFKRYFPDKFIVKLNKCTISFLC